MSNETFRLMWQDAMTDLHEQVQLEDPMLGQTDEAAPGEPVKPTIDNAFQHYACLYIKYMQIFQKLENCYDCMVHPQKREDVLVVLELVMRRVIELKHALVEWNPPRTDLQPPPPAQERPFSWEYVNLDDILVDLKLPPETLEVPVPRYFKENNAENIRLRDKVNSQYMNLKLEVKEVPIEETEDLDAPPSDMSLEQVIEIIQRNERGRQGKQRAFLFKDLREDEKRRHNYTSSQLEMDPEIAAQNIQRLFRGFFSRVKAAESRDEELIFIGMKPARETGDGLEKELSTAYKKRKTEQSDNKDAYAKALIDLKDEVTRDEGPQMRDELRQERHLWVTDFIAESKEIPEVLDEFYKQKYPAPPVAEEVAEEPAGKKKKDDKKGKGKEKGKKGKKKKAPAEEAPPKEPPALQGQSEITGTMYGNIVNYQSDWEDKEDWKYNFAQKHDVELAKKKIRVDVEAELKEAVDVMLMQNLAKIKAQLNPAKGGKKAKGKKKKGKGKGGKKAKGKKKKGKGGKALPGAKQCAGMELDQMLSTLVENKLINNYKERKISDLVGDFNYLGTVQQQLDRKDKKAWVPPDPSMAQLRASITEYCVLPLGSSSVKAKLETIDIKTVMLYGPSGSGKTMMVEAIASELGALLVNISPSRVKDAKDFQNGSKGADKLLHMIYEIAREDLEKQPLGNPNAPVVVYMDECEKFFEAGGKKQKVDKKGPKCFSKPLMAYKKGFKHNDRIIFVGTTSNPDKADKKEIKNFFDKFLFMPYPDYPSRLMLWRGFVKEQLSLSGGQLHKEIPDDFDLSTLARISEGFSAGAVHRCVKKTLTKRRVDRLDKRALAESEFINSLALEASKGETNYTYREDLERFRKFTAMITGLDDRRSKIEAEKSGDGDGGGGDKKKKGKGKKKK